MKRTFLVLALAPTLAACSSAEPQDLFRQPIAWEDCGGVFSCATLEVPFEHDTPGKGTFTLPLIRRPAEDPDARIGSLVINPGGPGGSGVSWVRFASDRLPQSVRARFDIIGFDPRGVGGSDPAVDCTDNLDSFVALDLSPDTPAERQEIIDTSQALVDACMKQSGDILAYIDTRSVARDMELLREALGDDKLSYVGFSYGTFLGAVYAGLFPDRVRALVLDGAIDPALSGEEIIMQQGVGFEEALGSFFADCAARADCAFYENGDPGAAFDALAAKLEAEPLAKAEGDRALGPGELFWGVTSALYSEKRWPKLADALASAAHAQDPTKLLALSDGSVGRNADGSYSDSIEQYEAVFSIDTKVPRDVAVYDALTDEMRVKAPRLGQYFAFSTLPTALWPLSAWHEPAPIFAKGAPPIVIVGTTRDPATPYAWSVALASELDAGVLVTREGDGHTGFGGKSACVDDLVASYLVDLKVPEDGATCP